MLLLYEKWKKNCTVRTFDKYIMNAKGTVWHFQEIISGYVETHQSSTDFQGDMIGILENIEIRGFLKITSKVKILKNVLLTYFCLVINTE